MLWTFLGGADPLPARANAVKENFYDGDGDGDGNDVDGGSGIFES